MSAVLSTTFVARPVSSPDADVMFGLAGTPMTDDRKTWRLELSESGAVELEVSRLASGKYSARWQFARGDAAELLGEVTQDSLALAGFDGVHLYSCRAVVAADGSLTGVWQVVYGGHALAEESFSGTIGKLGSRPGPKLPDRPVALAIPNVDLTRYRGKPTIVELAGSWCPTCKDIAPVWRDVHEKYGDRLNLVTLSYEFTNDSEHNRRRVEEFKRIYRMTWDVIPVGGDVTELGEIFPSEFGDLCFPVAFFVDSEGVVRSAQCGFSPSSPNGPAQLAELELEIERFLAASQ